MLEVGLDQDGNVYLNGRFDASQEQTTLAVFNKVNKNADVDCSKLEYISSAGIGVLLATQKRLMASGQQLSLKKLSPHIKEIFNYAGMGNIFKIE
jgi:anti-sigma B factor antagonist